MEQLLKIPKIGEKTAKRLIKHFGSADAAIEAIEKNDIESLAKVEGMNARQAISLIRETISLRHGTKPDDFLKTQEASEIYEKILVSIERFVHTDYARHRLRLFFPCPSQMRRYIAGNRKLTGQGMDVAKRLPDLGPMFEQVGPLKHVLPDRVRDRVLIVHGEEYDRARSRFGDLIAIEQVENPVEIKDILKGYSYVYATGVFAGFDFPPDCAIDFIDIEKTEPWYIVPETELAFYIQNLDSIKSSIEIVNTVRKTDPEFCKDLDLSFAGCLNDLSCEGEMMLHDADTDRLRHILEGLDGCVLNAEKEATRNFSEKIERSSITVKGFDILNAVKGEGIKHLFEKEIYDAYRIVIKEAKEGIKNSLDLRSSEISFLDELFSDEVMYPVSRNARGLDDFKQFLRSRLSARKIALLRTYAKSLAGQKGAVHEMVANVIHFDLVYSIGRFASEYDFKMPELIDQAGIGITDGVNMFLFGKNKNVEPVDYAVGETGFSPEINGEVSNSRIIILSGVNSGGKTSTIELLAQIVILAHMGFPVPAKQAEIGLIDELYYFAKSKGTLDAGAFETTIRNFSAVAGSNKRKIILVDELESITEPGASAKIIAGILEALSENPATLSVFVSHLAEAILKNTKCKIRVDGIEARGLDQNLNLIIDRSPRYNYLARSTPELIVEKLARAQNDNGNEKGFYIRLLQKFK